MESTWWLNTPTVCPSVRRSRTTAATVAASCAGLSPAWTWSRPLAIAVVTASWLKSRTRIAAAARANGVELALLSRAEALALESQLSCAGALHSPLTGIVDSHGLMLALLGEAERHGATLACASAVTRVVLEDRTVLVGVNDAEPALRARTLVNCAGVQAPAVARLMEGFPRMHIPVAYFAKGNYFTLNTRAPFQRLIYPLPEPGGLGIHLTLDLAGRARFGPRDPG